MNNLTQENYYQDKEYKTCSGLHNFVTYVFGKPVYSIQDFLNPPPLDTDNVQIGLCVDALITEGINFDEKYEVVDKRYGPKPAKLEFSIAAGEGVDVSAVLTQAKKFGSFEEEYDLKCLKTKSTLTLTLGGDYIHESAMHSFANDDASGLVTATKYTPAKIPERTQITNSMYESIITAKEALLAAKLSPTKTVADLIADPNTSMQTIFTDEEMKIKGKFDLCEFVSDKEVNIYDIKVTGSIDMVKKELFFNGAPNLKHKWVRQMSEYRHLVQVNHKEADPIVTASLIIVSHNGHVLIVRIGERTLDIAWEEVKADFAKLNAVLESGDYIQVSDVPEWVKEQPRMVAVESLPEEVQEFIFQV